jgi:hypothetical protein
MVKKRKVSEATKIKMRAAAQARWNKQQPKTVTTHTNDLVSRMTQAIDKIETQIKRLETL